MNHKKSNQVFWFVSLLFWGVVFSPNENRQIGASSIRINTTFLMEKSGSSFALSCHKLKRNARIEKELMELFQS